MSVVMHQAYSFVVESYLGLISGGGLLCAAASPSFLSLALSDLFYGLSEQHVAAFL
jgi:hypothetical protein